MELYVYIIIGVSVVLIVLSFVFGWFINSKIGKNSVASAKEQAKKIIEDLVKEVEVGQTYLGIVKRIEKFGAFVEVFQGKEGLVHISQLDVNRVEKVEDVIAVGDSIMVKVTEIDNQGRINLSRKAALKDNQVSSENN